MKLLRYGDAGRERPGLLDADGRMRDLSSVVSDIAGDTLLPENLARLRDTDGSGLPEVPGNPRIGPCVGSVGKFVCVGLNYSDHAAESGLPVPDEPVLFMKATSAICGPNDDVVIPRGAEKTDWEVELGIVIGRRRTMSPKTQALSHVAGYCVVNDVSERAFQIERGGQWDKGKGSTRLGRSGPGSSRPTKCPTRRTWTCGSRWTASATKTAHPHDDLRRGSSGQLHQPVHEPPAGRRHLDRHAAGGGARSEATGLPEARSDHASGHRRPR